jgi:undecaprenyl-diphosphatase
MLMTVTLHAATALSTIVVFWKEVKEIIAGLFQFKMNEQTRFSLKIILSMIPAVIIGLTMEDWINETFFGNLLLVGCMLIVTGVLLFAADRAKDTGRSVSFSNALLIGIAQAIAILPGISRSGATISTSVLLGIDRIKAARFSFLMVVPLILGKMAKDIMDGAFDDKMVMAVESSGTAVQQSIGGLELGLGFLAAFLTGLAACTWMITLVKNAKLSWFSYYCFIVGIIAIVSTLL